MLLNQPREVAQQRSTQRPVAGSPVGKHPLTGAFKLGILQRPGLVERPAVMVVDRVEGSCGDEVGESQRLRAWREE
jgi:hypothetical protein